MILAENLTKKFGENIALDNFNSQIGQGSIYGLVGSNGSGKSTLLRLISGVYRPDGGTIRLDDENPYENPAIKERIAFVADEPYFIAGSNMHEMSQLYASMYSSFDNDLYYSLVTHFPIDPTKKINTFSKGMKRQVALILAIATRPQFLLMDEAFDGLDPIMRGLLRKLLVEAIAEQEMTTVIASHNLRELEDLCDHMGLLHKGRVVFQREIDETKLGVSKVQVAFSSPPADEIFDNLNIISKEQQGSVFHLIVRGNSNEIKDYLMRFSPMFIDSIPLTLEEVFVYEMEAIGYDYNKIIF